jgi:hypothetical protein
MSAGVAAAASRPFGGRPIKAYFTGDSITKLPGMRRAFADFVSANGLDVDMVGAFSTGEFADNQHSAVSGVKIRSVRERAKLELGAGKPYPDVSLIFVLIGTNNINDAGVDVQAALDEYAGTLDVLSNLATSTVPDARIFVSTIPPIQPGVLGDAQVDEFNAGMPQRWDAFDARRPDNKLVRWDMHAGLSPWSPDLQPDSAHPNDAGFAKACGSTPLGLIPVAEHFFGFN